VRLIGIVAVAAASAPLLASCSGSDYSKTPWMAHDQQCEKLASSEAWAETRAAAFEAARDLASEALARKAERCWLRAETISIKISEAPDRP
jgi:hypothetical protein